MTKSINFKFLFCLLILTGVTSCKEEKKVAEIQEEETKPNIIIIYADGIE